MAFATKIVIMQEVSFQQATIDVWRRAFDFKGLTSRKEFWFGFLGIIIVNLIAFGLSFYSPFFSLLIAVNNFSLISTFLRRLRDAGYSPWLFLLVFLPIVSLVVFYLASKPSKINN